MAPVRRDSVLVPLVTASPRESFWQMVIEGLLIAFVVYFDNLQKRRQVGMG